MGVNGATGAAGVPQRELAELWGFAASLPTVMVPPVSVGRVDVNPKTRGARFEDPVVVSPPFRTA